MNSEYYNKKLFLGGIIILLFLTVIGSVRAIDFDSLVEVWKFDSVGSVAVGSRGVYNLTNYGASGTIFGKDGNGAFIVSGTNQKLLTNLNGNFPNKASVMFWFNFDQRPINYYTIWGIGVGSSGHYAQFRSYVGGKWSLQVYAGSDGNALVDENTIPTGWNLITIVRNEPNYYVYLNNDSSPIITLNKPGLSTASNFGFGRGIDTNLESLGGERDELMYFNKSLSTAEINEIYQLNLKGIYYPFETLNESLYNVTFPYPDNYYLNQSTLTYGFTTTDPNYNYTIWNVTGITNTSYSNVTINNNTNITLTLPDGEYYYGLTIFDQEGNSKQYGSNIIIDTTPPVISFGGGTPLNGSYLSSNFIFVNASVVEENFNNMSIFLYTEFDEISSVLSTNFTAYSSGPYNITSSFSDLSDGTYYINATAYDLAGNSNSTETRTITLDYYADNVSVSAYEKMTNNTIPFNLYLTNSTGGILYNFSSTNRTLNLSEKMARGYNYTVILNTTYGLGGYNTCAYNWTATDNYVFPECVFYNHRLNITAYNSYTGQAINIFNTTLTENTTAYTESQNTTNRTINYYILQGLNYSITLNPDAHFDRNITYAAATPTGTLNISVNQSIITLNFIHAFTQELINNTNITLNDTNYTGKIFNTSNGIIIFNPNTGTHNLKITSPRYVVRTYNLTVTDQDIRTINITLYPILNLSIYDEKLSGITPTYFNFSRPTQIKHTIYCSSNTTETKIISNTTPSGPYLLNTTCKMIKLRFDLEYSGIGGTTEYHRIIMPSPTINDFDFKVFIPDLSLPTSILQTFLEPNDIAGRYTLEKGTVLRVTKLMPTGTEVMIEDFMDAEGKITAYLIQGDSYILTVLAEGVPAKVVGIYNADSAGTKTLRLYNVGLIDPTLIGSTPTHTSLTDVRFYNLTENQSLLTMSYKDEGEFTNQLIMTIYNGSCNYKKNILIQSILERPDLILANFSAETSYNIFGSRYQNGSSNQIFCSVWNVTYSDGLTAYKEETMIYDSWIPRPGIFTDPWTFPWIVMLILITIALGLNARTVSLGSLLIMVLAGIMFAWNWVQAGTPGVKTFVVFGLALLIAIGLAFKRNVI